MKRFTHRPRLLLWLDRWPGAMACAFLTLIRKLGDWWLRKTSVEEAGPILFVKLTEQGSTVLASGAIRRAVARVGAEKVFFVVFEENRFILDLLRLIPARNVFVVRTRSAGSVFTSGIQCLFALRRLRLDACVDLEFFSCWSAVLGFLSGARRRAGFHAYLGAGPYRGDLLTHRVAYNPHLHTSRAFLSLIVALERGADELPTLADVPEIFPAPGRFQASLEERNDLQRLLLRLGVNGSHRLILLNANAGDLLPLRKWAGENYVGVARRLLLEFPEVQIVFTGSVEEAAGVDVLVRAVGNPRCMNLAGATRLRQLLVLYEMADVLLTNDSGPAHFAALTAIDTVVLFGPETPALFAPTGPRTHVIWAGLACSPCVSALNHRQTACRFNACMRAISVIEVAEKVGRIYRQRKIRAA